MSPPNSLTKQEKEKRYKKSKAAPRNLQKRTTSAVDPQPPIASRPSSAPNRARTKDSQRVKRHPKKVERDVAKPQNATQQIEMLRRKQNQHLLQVLEEEQIAEEQREAMMKQVKDISERRRLEKIFGVERGRASERIMRITEEHEIVLTHRMTDLGLR